MTDAVPLPENADGCSRLGERLWAVGRRIVIGGLVLAMVSSALAVIYTKHLSRHLFDELQLLQNERNEINVDWGRLLLEQSTWSTHGRIDQVARGELDMMAPPPDSTVVVSR
jgi:cell division protein FtsL